MLIIYGQLVQTYRALNIYTKQNYDRLPKNTLQNSHLYIDIVEAGPFSLLGHQKNEIEDAFFSHHILMFQMFRTLAWSACPSQGLEGHFTFSTISPSYKHSTLPTWIGWAEDVFDGFNIRFYPKFETCKRAGPPLRSGTRDSKILDHGPNMQK